MLPGIKDGDNGMLNDIKFSPAIKKGSEPPRVASEQELPA
jgi:hypothetical protein